MIAAEVKRTLVKSPPELWAELSDPQALARHLSELGEVRIVRSQPESAVEWEGEGVTGAVHIEASGWGTKVTLSATRQPPAPPEPTPEPVVEPEPPAAMQPEPEPESRRGFFARIFRRRRIEPAPEPEPQASTPEAKPEPEPQPDLSAELAAIEESMAAETTAVLTGVLDRLGAAHHRPFSRA